MALRATVCFGLLTRSTDSSHATTWPPFIVPGLGSGMVMAASSDAIGGDARVQDGGVAGGLQATTLRIGGAVAVPRSRGRTSRSA